LETTFVTEVQLTQTASVLQSNINQKLFTSSFNAYTQSNDTALNSLSTSVANRFTYTPTTGSNSFLGNQTITGSLTISSSAAIELNIIGNSTFSGSVRGQVFPLTITSQTASMDCSLGNFFTLTLAASSATNLQATNIQPGETIGLRITQPVGGYGSVTVNGGTIRFPQAFPYNATPSGSAIDVLSFQSYDSSSLYGVAVNTMR
jgi:hypothetical protein